MVGLPGAMGTLCTHRNGNKGGRGAPFPGTLPLQFIRHNRAGVGGYILYT